MTVGVMQDHLTEEIGLEYQVIFIVESETWEEWKLQLM